MRIKAQHLLAVLLPLLGCPLTVAADTAVAAATGAATPTAAAPSPAAAPLASLAVEPGVLGLDGALTISTDTAEAANKLRIGIYERNRPNRIADAKVNLAGLNGRLTVALRLEADPGEYELRLLRDDKARTVVSQPARLQVPGAMRLPGWFLSGGSPFIGLPPAGAAPEPMFLNPLKRDIDGKGAKRANVLRTATPVTWKTLTVAPPPVDSSLRARWHDDLANWARDARQHGDGGYVGCRLKFASDWKASPTKTDIRFAISAVRAELTTVIPDAPLILEIDVLQPYAATILDAGAALCDAVAIDATFGKIAALGAASDMAPWLVKTARRNAEEQRDYDLPIALGGEGLFGLPERYYFDAFMSGATILPAGGKLPSWQPIVARNIPLFLESVTLEDAGLLPLESTAATVDWQNQASRLYADLRKAGRIPLLGRALGQGDGKAPESLIVSIAGPLTPDHERLLRATAAEGGHLYLEGVPEDKTGGTTLDTLLGATFVAIPEQATTITFDDTWLFGTLRGRQIPVHQTAKLTLKPASMAAETRPEKGKDVLASPRVVAHFADGSPAIVLNPVKRGEVLWAAAIPDDSDLTPPYYAAVAGTLQGGLVDLRDQATSARPTGVIAALRRSKRDTLLLALSNAQSAPARLAVTVQTAAGVALDLASEKELPVTTRGFHTSFNVTVPADGYTLVALGENRKALDDERNANRLKARFR